MPSNIGSAVPVKNPDTPQERLKSLHDTSGLSWRKIANLDSYRGIPPGSLATFAKSGWLARRYRSRFGLPPVSTVVVMTGEPIPEGTQVITALRCSCGQWFVSNAPARRRCFLCSPWRGK